MPTDVATHRAGWGLPRRGRRLALTVLAGAAGALAACGSAPAGGGNPAVSATSSGVTAVQAAAAGDATDRAIDAAQRTLRLNPHDQAALDALAAAYLQKVREVGDPTYYVKARTLLQQAVAHKPDDVEALVLTGSLQLSLHHFADALTWGERARALDTYSSSALGVVVDAEVELGRYPEAVDSVQAMVDLRPDLSSYSRVSYLRELHGDVAGAITAMTMAVQAGGPVAENVAYVETQLGTLYLNSGDPVNADRSCSAALDELPGYHAALACRAAVAAWRGDLSAAATLYRQAVDVYPLPAYVIALGDVQAAGGDTAAAQQEYALVDAEQRLYAANGVDVDQELALFDADHGRNLDAALAAARRAVHDRPSVGSADALAWTLHRTGDDAGALAASRDAHRLGTRNPLFFFHSGMIEAALGMTAAARSDLDSALSIDAHFSVLWEPTARAELSRLGGAA